MQRVVSINLNGNAYQIEENGYTALFAYLDAMESALQDDPDRARKLAEVERLIAEKCQACLNAHKTVVTSAEIDRLLLELDPARPQPAAEPAAPSGSSPSSNASSPADATPPPPNQASPNWSSHRRLFQIREGAMISGVCVGLSEFLHIDVTVIRILFAIVALGTSGWGILAYGLLMFLLPRVDTRAAASDGVSAGTVPPHHWPWDNGWPWDHPAGQDWRRAGRDAAREARRVGLDAARNARRAARDARHAARMAHPGPAFGTMTMVVFLMLGFFWLSFWTRGHFFLGWPFFWGAPHWIGIVFFFIVLRLVFMPFRMARWSAYGPYGPYPHPHYAWVSMWNGLMWFASMIFIVWIAYHYVPEVHDFIRSFQTSWSDGGLHV